MPKEQINFPQWRMMLHGLPGSNSPREGATAEVDDTLLVRWHDGSQVEGYVQLTLVHQEPQPYKDFEGAVVWPPTGIATERYSPVLSREDLNRLIKALRRARDQAYGRDE